MYAETATNCSATPLGAETNLIKSTDDIPATVIPTPELLADGTMPIRILNAVGPNSGSLEITLVAPEGTSNQLSVAVFARPRKAVFDAPDQKLYPCVGGVLLPPLASNKVFSTTINLRTPNFPSWWYDVFVCNTDTGVVRGHFVGVAHFKK